MFKNWKTSLAGLGGIITGISLIVKGDIAGGVTGILTGIGLLAAKDHDSGLNQ